MSSASMVTIAVAMFVSDISPAVFTAPTIDVVVPTRFIAQVYVPENTSLSVTVPEPAVATTATTCIMAFHTRALVGPGDEMLRMARSDEPSRNSSACAVPVMLRRRVMDEVWASDHVTK